MSIGKLKMDTLRLLTKKSSYNYLVVLITVFFLFGAAPVAAEEKSAEDWNYDFQIYLWGSSIKGTTATYDPISVTFGDLLKNLEFAAMGTFGVRKNKFSMLADVIYLNVGTGQSHDGDFLGQPVEGKLDIGLKGWVLNFVGGYNLVEGAKHTFDLTAGARYLDMTTSANFKFQDKKKKIEAGDNLWDGVIGFKGRHNFSDGHYINYYADIGGGDSKRTWQAMANVAYDFKKWTGVFGYRYLHWNLKNDAKALSDLTLHGPYVAAKWSF